MLSSVQKTKIKTKKNIKPVEKPQNLFNNLIDIFEKNPEYPDARVRCKKKNILKNPNKSREALIEEMPSTDIYRQTYLHKLVNNSSKPQVKFLASHAHDQDILSPDIYGRTPAHYAAENGVLSALINSRKNIIIFLEIQDMNGDTPVHIMAKYNKFDCFFIKHITKSDLYMLLNIKNAQDLSILDILKSENLIIEHNKLVNLLVQS